MQTQTISYTTTVTDKPIADKITLDVGGMKCAGCVKAVERQLAQYPGVTNVVVNLATEIAVVESLSGVVDPNALAQKITDAGFPSQIRKSDASDMGNNSSVRDLQTKHHQEMHNSVIQLVIAAVLLIFSGIGHFGHLSGMMLPVVSNIWFHCGLATLALLIPGREIIVDGWRSLWRNTPNMNTLVALGTLTAYIASLIALLFPNMAWECFFDEPVMMLGFILLGRTLEKRARGRASAAFRKLLSLQPVVARLIANPHKTKKNNNTTNFIEIPAAQVRVGEWLQVLPSEKIPVDGEVIEGKTTVDESMLSGEAVPVLKQPGDTVAAGSINQSGAIVIQAKRTGDDTTLAHIVALVENAQTRKAPVQKLADTVAGYFTYGVLGAAILTFVFWYFIGVNIWDNLTIWGGTTSAEQASLLLSVKLAIAVMVVACPCALGLATPTAILVGTAIAAEKGLLIKGGDVLERVHQLDTVIFDKTGTLTIGKPTVTDCLLLEELLTDSSASHKPEVRTHKVETYEAETYELGTQELSAPTITVTFPKERVNLSPVPDSESLLKLAAAVESGTVHPFATAIISAAQQQNLTIPTATDFRTEPGLGVSGVVEEQSVLLGNKAWLNLHGIVVDEILSQAVQNFTKNGKTVVYVAVNSTIAGIIAISDIVRTDAVSVVENLQKMNLRVMLLSGDAPEVAIALGRQLNLDDSDIIAGVMPGEKAEVVKSLQTNQKHVGMVGDGINDAPALSQADVGIALHSGTDVAMETADIILMRDSLNDVVESIRFSRATFNKIRQNLFWAFAYNTLGIPLAAGILLPSFDFVLTPAGAAALMAFSSVSVVTNSLLLRRFT
ncbi:heavy metal translocating P-type ATPase [Mastigocoleus sp. MO_188.B34]|uniref:heavy metal translocating P-type ATPase n=1 Tax=Mastigocoleus sp. MO_188.B34 TaxID=3036635 RepID=UPI00260A8E3D|nr:heavy metal translocating P-type ATPase [Mastigocoleus sp. MO_188.B34]MDJ0694770.1 heavy metal translocating P-type ATPase [Mastigocoleus sp. MO_188.B34]